MTCRLGLESFWLAVDHLASVHRPLILHRVRRCLAAKIPKSSRAQGESIHTRAGARSWKPSCPSTSTSPGVAQGLGIVSNTGDEAFLTDERWDVIYDSHRLEGWKHLMLTSICSGQPASATSTSRHFMPSWKSVCTYRRHIKIGLSYIQVPNHESFRQVGSHSWNRT